MVEVEAVWYVHRSRLAVGYPCDFATSVARSIICLPNPCMYHTVLFNPCSQNGTILLLPAYVSQIRGRYSPLAHSSIHRPIHASYSVSNLGELISCQFSAYSLLMYLLRIGRQSTLTSRQLSEAWVDTSTPLAPGWRADVDNLSREWLVRLVPARELCRKLYETAIRAAREH